MIIPYISPAPSESIPMMLDDGLSESEKDFLSAVLPYTSLGREYSSSLEIVLREVFTEKKEKYWYFEGTAEDFQLSSDYEDPYSDFYKRFFSTHIKPVFATLETAFSMWENMSACGRFLLCTYALCTDRSSVDSFAPHPVLARITTFQLLQICNELGYLKKVVTNDRKLGKEIKNTAVTFLTWQYDFFLKEMKNRNRSCSEVAVIKIKNIACLACYYLASSFSYFSCCRRPGHNNSLPVHEPASELVEEGMLVVHIDPFNGVVVDRQIHYKKSK